MLTIVNKGDLKRTSNFFKGSINSINPNFVNILDKYAKEGVKALQAVTPVDSGMTKDSWTYKIKKYKGGAKISWVNSNVVDNVLVAVILQYGHGTGNGGYVEGRDYINPALKPIFDNLATEVWREVTKL